MLFSLALVVLDARFSRVDELRSWLGSALTPVVWLGHMPDSLQSWSHELLSTRDELIAENESLRARILVLERRSNKYASLAAENQKLRGLKDSSSQLDETVVVANIIGVSPDPFTHEVIINKGKPDDVAVGQAILDANGLMGQVIQTSRFTSRVLLISDSSHAVPVEVLRSSVRAILLGKGSVDSLELVHVPDTADVREGDMLISSGLGGRFPRGYPVATITSIERESGQSFSNITARPAAALNRSELVLVVFKPRRPVGASMPGSDESDSARSSAADSENAEDVPEDSAGDGL